jgi:hypothetical protein
MTEFENIPGVRQNAFSHNRDYQEILDSFMAHFGSHLEHVEDTLGKQCEFHDGHAGACSRLKHTCAAVADAAAAVKDERPEMARAAQDFARQSIESMKTQFEYIDANRAQQARELHDHFKLLQAEVVTLRSQSMVYQQRFAQQDEEQRRLVQKGVHDLAGAQAAHAAAHLAMTQ